MTIEPWILVTVAAAFFQCLRTALQTRLLPVLGTAGAAYARFAFGLPLALLVVAGLVVLGPDPLPAPTAPFFALVLLAGMMQALGMAAMLTSFAGRGFAVGTAYTKTETIQTALLSTLLLAEPVSAGAWIGIVVSLAGVLTLTASAARVGLRSLLTGWTQRSALAGLGAGLLLAVSTICVRAATVELGDGAFVMRAAFTLAVMLAMQAALVGAYLFWRQRRQLTHMFGQWRLAAPIGIGGVLSSGAWYIALTLENAALVNAVGQIELVFTFVASRLLRERVRAVEVLGILLVIGGVLGLLLGR